MHLIPGLAVLWALRGKRRTGGLALLLLAKGVLLAALGEQGGLLLLFL